MCLGSKVPGRRAPAGSEACARGGALNRRVSSKKLEVGKEGLPPLFVAHMKSLIIRQVSTKGPQSFSWSKMGDEERGQALLHDL